MSNISEADRKKSRLLQVRIPKELYELLSDSGQPHGMSAEQFAREVLSAFGEGSVARARKAKRAARKVVGT